MKRTDLLILTSTLAYSYLFYSQGAGVNFLIFDLIIIILFQLRNSKLIRNSKWIFAVLITLLSGIAVTLTGTFLSSLTNIFAVGLLSAFSVNSQSSVIVALLQSAFSALTSVYYIAQDFLKKKQQQIQENKTVGRTLTVTIPLVLVMLFVFLYRESNPVFKQVTNSLNLEFISIQWIIFTVTGAVLCYAIYFHRMVPQLALYDRNAPQSAVRTNSKLNLFGMTYELREENSSGIILLLLLNTLLLFLNFLDVKYLFYGSIESLGMSYSELVHQGTEALIVSILIAIAIILFYFRSNLNFFQNNAKLKTLTYVWILQNVFMICSTAYRNFLYIDFYSLTYKRIGVFIFLVLALGGLFTTLFKVASARSNYFLFRINSWIAFSVMIIASFFVWDKIIAEYNTEQAAIRKKVLDTYYLEQLSDAAIPMLIKAYSKDSNSKSHSYYGADRKLLGALTRFENMEWQSWNRSDVNTRIGIIHQNQQGQINSMFLNNESLENFPAFEEINGIKSLSLHNNRLKDLKGIGIYTQLSKLDVSSNDLVSIESLPESVVELDLSSNPLRNIKTIGRCKGLEKLDIKKTAVTNLSDLKSLSKLKTLDLSFNHINNADVLAQLDNIETLDISFCPINDLYFLEEMDSLKKLSLNSRQIEQLKAQRIDITGITLTRK